MILILVHFYFSKTFTMQTAIPSFRRFVDFSTELYLRFARAKPLASPFSGPPSFQKNEGIPPRLPHQRLECSPLFSYHSRPGSLGRETMELLSLEKSRCTCYWRTHCSLATEQASALGTASGGRRRIEAEQILRNCRLPAAIDRKNKSDSKLFLRIILFIYFPRGL